MGFPDDVRFRWINLSSDGVLPVRKPNHRAQSTRQHKRHCPDPEGRGVGAGLIGYKTGNEHPEGGRSEEKRQQAVDPGEFFHAKQP